MTPQLLRSSYDLDAADPVGGDQFGRPERLLRLFISLPAYAENERGRILARLAGLNSAFSGVLRILPSGSGLEAAEADGAMGAADCDAVIAVLRPRFPDDPEVAEQAGARGGAAGLVSAMGKGSGAGLPDIYIFRYAGSPEEAAADTDWQSGKRAFEAWFRARGGETLSFDDFFSSADFAGQLDARLGSWLNGLGFEQPPVGEVVAFEPAGAEELPSEPDIPASEPGQAAVELAREIELLPEIGLVEAGEPSSVIEVPEIDVPVLAGLVEEAPASVAEPDLAEAPETELSPAAELIETEEPSAIAEPMTNPVVDETMPEIEPAPSPEIFKTYPSHEESSEVVRRDRFRRLTNFLYRRQATYTPPEEPEPEAIPYQELAAEIPEAALAAAEPEGAEQTETLECNDVEVETLEEAARPVVDLEGAEEADDTPTVEGEFCDPAADEIEMPARVALLDEPEIVTEPVQLVGGAAPETWVEAGSTSTPAAPPESEAPEHALPESWEERVSPKVIPLRPERAPVEPASVAAGRGVRPAMLGMTALTAASFAFAVIAGLMWIGAKSTTSRVQKRLAAATEDAGKLVFSLTEEARRLGGATSEGSKTIVNAAQKLHGTLLANGHLDTEELYEQAYIKMNEAASLAKQNKLADALKAATEGERLFQTLVDLDPGKVDWQQRLAMARQRIGDVMVVQNNLIEALGAYRDDVAIRRMLSAKDPDNVEKRTELSAAQIKVGDVLAGKGRLEDALSIYQDALKTRKTLAQSYVNNADRQRDLMEVDNKVGDVLTAQNHLDDALAIYREALAVTGKMAVMNPADPRWREASAQIDNKIGDVLVGKARVDDALASYRDGLAIMKDVAANEPNNSEWQGSIAAIHQRIGDAFTTEMHFESALAAYRDELAVIQGVLAKDAKNASWRHAASEAQLRIGQVLFSQKNLDGSLAAHRESLNIMKALAAEDPANARYQHDLMMNYSDIGILLNTKGVRAEALAAYRDARQIAATMAVNEPNNSDWPAARAMIDNNLGALQMDLGNHDDGVATYRDGLEVSKGLAARDPRNAEWQAGLAVALYNLGEAGVDTEANLTQARDLLARLDNAGALRPDKKALIPHVDEALAKLHGGDARKHR